MALGWSLNWEKSNFVPSQEVLHLGFIINTRDMTAKCPQDKIKRLQDSCKQAFKDRFISAHDLECLLGTMESVRPVTRCAALHYRALQRQLLKVNFGGRKPKELVFLSKKSLLFLKWWISPSGFAANCITPLREPAPSVEIWTDSNLQMAGGHSSRGDFFQREWNPSELATDPHIILLETIAAKESVLNLAHPGDLIRCKIHSSTDGTGSHMHFPPTL